MILIDRDKYSEKRIYGAIMNAIGQLEKYGSYTERIYSAYRTERVSTEHALRKYLETIQGKAEYAKRSIEPLTALWCDTKKGPAVIKWRSEKQTIGEKIIVEAMSPMRDEVLDIITAWAAAGYKYGSTGGIFYTVPNKSYMKIKTLHDHEEFLNPVINMEMQQEWIEFFSKMIALRLHYSISMLELKEQDPEIFSRDNKEAGCGVLVKGRRVMRSDLDDIPSEELTWLLDIMAGSAIQFAATQCVDPGSRKVWLTKCLDPRVKGALGARSDGDIEEARLTGDILYTTATFECRQIFANGGGALANAKSEMKHFGKSVMQMNWENAITDLNDYLFPPFKGLSKLVEYWCSATPSTGRGSELTLICNDFGLVDPIKAGADNLFSKCFVEIEGRVMPELTSGAWWTSSAYIPFHRKFCKRFVRAGIIVDMLTLGDDMNARVRFTDLEKGQNCFSPYKKFKGTDGPDSKILGYMTHRDGDTYTVMNTPRIQKSTASAKQMASLWANVLPDTVDATGSMEITIPPEIDEAVVKAIPAVKELIFFKASKSQIVHEIQYAWQKARDIASYLDYLPSWMEQFPKFW